MIEKVHIKIQNNTKGQLGITLFSLIKYAITSNFNSF